ncbi:maltose operon protein MalM [Acerihabitans sp. TG2]|uniref:maltose operon protein MalM n=1 Tax=Acerihabitans sp. TG2 TaxID=3096008 RepID=UPI002B23D90D|nr:maltose operon protein MalM [Acerihabitans sp. TG2]MEA9391517.1 maltose operon protein MalM [Acerihabitans sp. TG2]
MNKNILTLCLTAALIIGSPAAAHAAPRLGSENIAVAPSLSPSALQQLPWDALIPPSSKNITLDSASPRLSQGNIQGAVAAFTLPANRGTLDITLSSIVDHGQVFVPNVLILDEQLRPAAFFPSSYFPYQKPGMTAGERLSGTMKLTPALGQQQIYLLIYTTRQDLAGTTTLTNPAKAYAEGIGTSAPSIPDPIAHHAGTGKIKVEVVTEQNSSNIMIGQPFSSPSPAPVVVGTAQPLAATTTMAPAAPVLNDTESYFNQSIKQAVNDGNIDKALKLLNEAERLGSTSARQTFISSVKGKG